MPSTRGQRLRDSMRNLAKSREHASRCPGKTTLGHPIDHYLLGDRPRPSSLCHLLQMNFKGQNVAVILTGGNIDMTMLMRVIRMEQFALHRAVKLYVYAPDKPSTVAEYVSPGPCRPLMSPLCFLGFARPPEPSYSPVSTLSFHCPSLFSLSPPTLRRLSSQIQVSPFRPATGRRLHHTTLPFHSWAQVLLSRFQAGPLLTLSAPL